MRISMLLELKSKEILSDYRRTLVSFIKKSISDFDDKLYSQLYQKVSFIKPFTFAVKLKSPVFEDKVIHVNDKQIELNFSTGDTILGIELYNAFLAQRKIPFAMPLGNEMIPVKVTISNTPQIDIDSAKIKFLSPLIVRKHNENNLDKYLYFGNDEFETELFKIVQNELEKLCGMKIDNSEFRLIPVSPKKTVTSSMGIKFACSIGIFEISASSEIINALYQYGIGSRRSEGFGMFDIL